MAAFLLVTASGVRGLRLCVPLVRGIQGVKTCIATGEKVLFAQNIWEYWIKVYLSTTPHFPTTLLLPMFVHI